LITLIRSVANVATTWSLAVDHIHLESVAAADLLIALAFFHCD
jgi:hypothetical protein